MNDAPTHIGIIMDGNRRWAEEQGVSTKDGHTKGQENLRIISRAAFEQGVQYVSVYAFSTENWRRTEEEVGHLMGLLVRGVDKYLQEFNEASIKVVFIGQRDDLDKKVLKAIQKAEDSTSQNEKGTLVICFNYGGQQEIVDAAKKIIASGMPAESITTETVAANLYNPDIPPIDLIIRTSGEQRLSNFMLWRAAYSEFYFVDKHWPAFAPDDLREALEVYAARGRRFGK
jgi:undecaprenyl diphosphate synthase